jgi:hypothetical protein
MTLASNVSFPPIADISYPVTMNREFPFIVGFLILACCSKQLPEICLTTPPEAGGSGYDKWFKDYKAAHCYERLKEQRAKNSK